MDEWIDIPMQEDAWVDIPSAPQSGLSSGLLNFVKEVEGYNPRAYSDYKQFSIGWGTRAQSPNEVIDEEEAERRLRAELSSHQARVIQAANKVGAKFTQGQLDALTSFDYNTGKGAYLVESSKGDVNNIAQRIPQYRLAGGEVLPGLVKRRAGEMALFGQPDDPDADKWQDLPHEGEWVDIGHGQEVAAKETISEPQGSVSQGPFFLPDDQLKGKIVKLHTTDPDSGETIEEETDALTAQSFIKGNIDAYSTLIDCLSK